MPSWAKAGKDAEKEGCEEEICFELTSHFWGIIDILRMGIYQNYCSGRW